MEIAGISRLQAPTAGPSATAGLGLDSDEDDDQGGAGGDGSSAAHVTAKTAKDLEDKLFGAESSDEEGGAASGAAAGGAAGSSSNAAAAPAASAGYGAGGDGYDSMDEFIERDDDGSGVVIPFELLL